MASPASHRDRVTCFDRLFDGAKIRALTIVDTFLKLSPAIDILGPIIVTVPTGDFGGAIRLC